MKKTDVFTWFGEYSDESLTNLEKLSKDLGVRFQTSMKDGQKYFKFEKLDEPTALRLVKTIRKYGLAVTTNDPLSGLLKTNYDAQLAHHNSGKGG